MNKQGYSSAQTLEQAVRAVVRKSHKDTETGFRGSLALNQPGHCMPPRRTLFRTRRTEAETMMYPYMTLEDGTEMICSQIIPQEDIDTVLVHFERPTARVSTPRAASFPAMNGRAGGERSPMTS